MNISHFDADTDPKDVLRTLRHTLSRVFHDANNPLSIVSGNAQYVIELGKAMDLDDDIVQPVRDIEEASERVTERLKDISRIRDEIDSYLSSVDERGTS